MRFSEFLCILLVRPYLTLYIPALRHLLTEHQLAEPSSHYFVNDAGVIWRQIAETLHLMTAEEQQRLRDLLAREGISGFLSRLGIASQK